MTGGPLIACMRNQHGLITFDQALLIGLTPDQVRARVRRGEWVGVARRLYRSAVVPVSFEQRVLGACLLAGSDANASHMTAAVLHRLEGARPGRVHITVPRGRTHTSPVARVHQANRPARAVRIARIPVTPVDQTLADLAGHLADGPFEAMLDHAFVHGLASPERLRTLRGSVTRGAGRLDRSLVVWTPGPRPGSVPEIRLARLLVAAGYPVPERQIEIFDANGNLVARADLGYPTRRVVFEYLGADGHTPRTEVPDRAREHDIRAAGWELVSATKHTFGPGRERFLRAVGSVYHGARAA